MVILTLTSAGAAMSEALMRRVVLLRALDRFLEKAFILIRSEAASFEDIVSEGADDERLSQFVFLGKIKERIDNGEVCFRRIWRESLEEYKPDYMQSEELSVLFDFGETLGSTDTEGQLQRISGMRDIICGITKEAEKNYRDKGKLYRALGVTAGLFAAVVLI